DVMYTEYKLNDEVFICGVISRRGYNPMCKGKIIHTFNSPFDNTPQHVIAVDVLDGEFIVRDAPTMAPSLDVQIGCYGHMIPRKRESDDDPQMPSGMLTGDTE